MEIVINYFNSKQTQKPFKMNCRTHGTPPTFSETEINHQW